MFYKNKSKIIFLMKGSLHFVDFFFSLISVYNYMSIYIYIITKKMLIKKN